MNIKQLPLKNIIKRPVRSVCLMLLVAFLAFTVFAGTMMVTSLNNGLNSLQARLGADVVVVPYEAKTKVDLENMLLQGTPGYFYMSKNIENKISEVPGIKQYTSQIYLASAKSGCCSARVQLIGYDPDTDFVVAPWVEQTYDNDLGLNEVVVGADISPTSDGEFILYDIHCKVVGQLDKTGTGLDTAVYCNKETLRTLIDASVTKGMNAAIGDNNPEDMISSIYIDVEDDSTAQSVADYINIHVRGVQAVPIKSMLAGVGDSLKGISGTITMMIVFVWVLALALLVVVFSMLTGERKKEFAILRAMGSSRNMLAKTVLKESGIISIFGAILGVLVGAAVIFPFHRAIEAKIGLPFLFPTAEKIVAFVIFSLIITILAGSLASAIGAFRLSRIDVGTILREGN